MANVRRVGYDPNKVEAGSNYIDYASKNSLPAVVKIKCTEAKLDETFKSGSSGAHLLFTIVAKAPGKGKAWSTLHHRFVYYENPDEAWNEAQMMDALIGKRVKTYKPADLVGKTCLAKLRAEDYEGETTARIARLMPLDDEDFESDDEPDEEDDEDVEEDDEDEDESDEDEDESDDEGDEEEEDSYEDWSLPQLRAELDRRGLDTKGRKPAMVARLEENDNADNEVVDYSEWDRDELAEEAKRRGLKVLKRHSEDDLIEMLEEDDQDDEDPLAD